MPASWGRSRSVVIPSRRTGRGRLVDDRGAGRLRACDGGAPVAGDCRQGHDAAGVEAHEIASGEQVERGIGERRGISAVVGAQALAVLGDEVGHEVVHPRAWDRLRGRAFGRQVRRRRRTVAGIVEPSDQVGLRFVVCRPRDRVAVGLRQRAGDGERHGAHDARARERAGGADEREAFGSALEGPPGEQAELLGESAGVGSGVLGVGGVEVGVVDDRVVDEEACDALVAALGGDARDRSGVERLRRARADDASSRRVGGSTRAASTSWSTR